MGAKSHLLQPTAFLFPLSRGRFSSYTEKKNRQSQVNSPCALPALRLCVWLFDNRYIQLSCGDQCFMLAFGTVQREVFKNCIFSYSYSRFGIAYWTQYPCFDHCFVPSFLQFLKPRIAAQMPITMIYAQIPSATIVISVP